MVSVRSRLSNSHRQIIDSVSRSLSRRRRSGALTHMRISLAGALILIAALFIALFCRTLTGAQSAKPVLSVTATKSIAGPQPGVFTITRTGNTSAALSIPYDIGGTATRDVDYTLSGATGLDSPFAPGKVAQAFSLDGEGRYALFPDDPAQDLTAEATIDAWVFFNQTPSAAGHIMSIVAKSDFGRDLDLQVEQDNRFHFYVASGALNVASSTVIQSGRWYHVAATYKANTELKMYVNGVLENTRAITVAREANGKPLAIGESVFFRGRFFKGLIDEAHMFNRALSAAEVQSIFAVDSAGLCKPAPATNCLTPPPGLVGWWPGDGRTVDVENGNAGTLFGVNVIMGVGQTSLTVNVNPTGSTGSDGKNVVFTLLPTPDVYDLDAQASSALLTLSGQAVSNNFAISSVEPNRGGDTGSVTTTIFGQNILPGAAVKLVRAGQPDIPGGQSIITDDGFSVTTVFDLTGKARGAYDVIVTNPDGTSRPLANGFAVEPSTSVQLFGRVIARAVIRIGNEYPFYIQYGNRGNTDALNIPLYISVPNFVTITPDTNLPFQVSPDGDRTLVTVMLPRIRARSDRLAEFFTVKIKVTDPNQFHHIFETRASIGQPFAAPAAGVAQNSAKDAARAEASTVSSIFPLDVPPPGSTDPRTPNDPNEKDGPAGFGVAGFLTGADAFSYAIYFENKDTATLPAQDVIVTDQLDPNLVDLSTFNFGPISFGNRHVTPPLGQTQFVTQVDLRPAKQIILRITGKLDTATGLLTWRFNSLDPVTGGPPDDPQAGFLPPNVHSPEGQGGVLFTVTPKAALATGTEVRNKARIVFDVNTPIDTDEYLNTIDNSRPVSQVAQLAATQTTHSFVVNWSGTDVGSGISGYNVFVSENGGPFTLWQVSTTATSAIYYGGASKTYRFYSLASDLAGNQETNKTAADAITTTSAGSPIDEPRWFVRQHYLDFLNREPDQSGLNFWTGQITSCGSDAACTEVRRINVSAAFFLSIEFQQTGYLVERVYKTAYGDATGTSTLGGSHQLAVPVVRFNEFLADTQRIGRGVVVLAPGWEQALENNKQAYAGEFVATSRFIAAFPTTMTPTQFVDKLNQNAGNVLSASERTTAINLFNGAVDSSNTTARARALRQVAEDPDLFSAESNRAFVLTQFFGYLRRNPNDPQDTDYTGYEFWLSKLNQFHGDYLGAEMVKAFIASSEYRQRFGP